MKNNKFPFRLNQSTDVLNRKILRWAWDKKLVVDAEELERFRIQKINSFSGFLFPDASEEELNNIMKLFLCLFLLDDLLDTDYEFNQLEFLKSLSESDQAGFNLQTRLGKLGFELSLLSVQIDHDTVNHSCEQSWKEVWQFYLDGLKWEVLNKLNNTVPSLTEYQLMRPHASGVFLAIHLLKSNQVTEGCETQLLEQTIARFICLSNDLASWSKEEKINDFHNELLLLRMFYGEKAFDILNMELGMLEKKIYSLSELLISRSEECRQWVDSLLHLVGGCIAWSNLTFRYEIGINGKSTPHR